MSIDKNIGRKIKYLRKKKNITQTDLGKAVFDKSESACQNTIKNIETGRRNTKPAELATILNRLDISDVEFNDLTLSGDPEPVTGDSGTPETESVFPEIGYYQKLYRQAQNAGDAYMVLQIYKAMARKIEEKISEYEAAVKQSIPEK